MTLAVAGDRIWFERNPQAVVRLRREKPHEFDALHKAGKSPPCFIPSGFRPDSQLNWVAIIHLSRLIEGHSITKVESIRIRVKTIGARSKANQAMIKEELIEAVAKELLSLFNTDNAKQAKAARLPSEARTPA